ncbi:MAG: EAL domain-containing protein [Desulfobacteraceae bacterium]|jgi:EAL domain-containing protein (putative c-di-GMP-specific phosphodiesterase class I)
MTFQFNTSEEKSYDIETIKQFVSHNYDEVVGYYKTNFLRSAFQPIFSIAHKRIVGYEALIRGQNRQGRNISPFEIFAADKSERAVVFLDRLCRYLHLGNYQFIGDDINWLYLNLAPSSICNRRKYGVYFEDLLQEYNFLPSRVVVEIVEYPIQEEELLMDAVNYYKSLGCLIAIDDFGAGYSNFERVWKLAPHVVKLDRSMIEQASGEKKIRDLFPGVVSLLHQAGSLVLIEGIETEEQAIIALDSDADFVQGYYFARPMECFSEIKEYSFPFNSLFDTYKKMSAKREELGRNNTALHKKLILKVIEELKQGESLEDASNFLKEEESVIRCYLLLPDGRQIGNTVLSKKGLDNVDPRFKPLEDAKSADWFRRHYLNRAVMHPDQIQVTRPYLSITGGHMCTTMSIMFNSPDGNRVFCCDLINERE